MKELPWLKKLYQPIQPSVSIQQRDVSYKEYHPAHPLQSLVYTYWQLKTAQTLKEDFIYKVVSDGCIDIFFNLENPSESFVMGFCRKYTEFSLGTNFNFVGIRFFPSSFPQLFGVSAKQLSNTSHPLKAIIPTVAQFIEQTVSSSHSMPTLTQQFNQFFQQKIQQQAFDFDFRFYDALQLILQKNGNLDIETDLNTGISPRQLRRLFNYYLGTTPKAFSKVVRFQYVLNAIPSFQSLKEHKLYYDAGFYDQAHFIKDFKNFYGVTPMVAFR